MSIMNQIYQQAAIKLGLSEELVKEVGEHSFAWMRHQMIDPPEQGKILYANLGTFSVLTKKMEKALERNKLSKEDRDKTINLLNKIKKQL